MGIRFPYIQNQQFLSYFKFWNSMSSRILNYISDFYAFIVYWNKTIRESSRWFALFYYNSLSSIQWYKQTYYTGYSKKYIFASLFVMFLLVLLDRGSINMKLYTILFYLEQCNYNSRMKLWKCRFCYWLENCRSVI